MSDSMPLPNLVAAPPSAAPPAAANATVAGDAAPQANPVAALQSVTDADSLFNVLMDLATATPPMTVKVIAHGASADDDDPVPTDPIAIALLGVPDRREAPAPLTPDAGVADVRVIPSAARDLLNGSLVAEPALSAAEGLLGMTPHADETPTARATLALQEGAQAPALPAPAQSAGTPKLAELSLQLLAWVPASAEASAHRAAAADTSRAVDAPPAAPMTPPLPLPATATAQADAPQAPPDITVPPSHPRWGEQIAASVVWCVKQKLTEAELRLHPPELGPLRVTLRLTHDSVDVRFVAANPLTRDALEQTLPQLRDLFQQQGISLAQAQVGDGTNASRDRAPSMPAVPALAPEGAADGTVATATVQLKRLGLLDEFA